MHFNEYINENGNPVPFTIRLNEKKIKINFIDIC